MSLWWAHDLIPVFGFLLVIFGLWMTFTADDKMNQIAAENIEKHFRKEREEREASRKRNRRMDAEARGRPYESGAGSERDWLIESIEYRSKCEAEESDKRYEDFKRQQEKENGRIMEDIRERHRRAWGEEPDGIKGPQKSVEEYD